MLNITIVLVEHPITWSLKLMYCLLFLVWMPIVGQTWGRWWWPRWWGPQTARRRCPPGGAPNFFPKEVCIFVTSLQHCFLQLIAISCNFLITMGWGCQTWGHWRWPWSRGAKTARRGGPSGHRTWFTPGKTSRSLSSLSEGCSKRWTIWSPSRQHWWSSRLYVSCRSSWKTWRLVGRGSLGSRSQIFISTTTECCSSATTCRSLTRNCSL